MTVAGGSAGSKCSGHQPLSLATLGHPSDMLIHLLPCALFLSIRGLKCHGGSNCYCSAQS